MQGIITFPINIQEECGVIIGKLKHDNYYNPIDLIVFKNTIGEFTAEVGDMGEYRLVSNGLFPPSRTWVSISPYANFKKVEPLCEDADGHCIELNIDSGADLNGYIDFRIEVYP